MRDPARMHRMLSLVAQAWGELPDMRLGQLIVAVSGTSDPWNVEDDVMEDMLREYIETSRSWTPR